MLRMARNQAQDNSENSSICLCSIEHISKSRLVSDAKGPSAEYSSELRFRLLWCNRDRASRMVRVRDRWKHSHCFAEGLGALERELPSLRNQTSLSANALKRVQMPPYLIFGSTQQTNIVHVSDVTATAAHNTIDRKQKALGKEVGCERTLREAMPVPRCVVI